jgi:hypothetical protein
MKVREVIRLLEKNPGAEFPRGFGGTLPGDA